MCRKIDILKWGVRCGGLALLFLLNGCATDFHTPLFNLNMALTSSPAETKPRVPVFYPDAEGRQGANGSEPLVEAYGSAWQDLHTRYPEYRFN